MINKGSLNKTVTFNLKRCYNKINIYFKEFLVWRNDIMTFISKILIGIVAIEHIYILWIEMFAWTTKGASTFKSLPQNLFPSTKVLAGNQGLYNGFISAGLIWSLLITDQVWAQNIAIFFLIFIVIAGVYGAITAEKSIVVKQAIPAFITIMTILF